jgi:DNA-binding response OmpR family regulator/nitrogen-specific signal transduction histidine kinase
VTAILNARLFQEIQQKSRQLEMASRHKSQFLANMSHELRTPLNSIIGFSEVLLEEMFGELNEKQDEYLKDILGSGKHLLNLINDILDLSKIEAGKMELELGTISLRQLLEGSLAVIKERALAHGIQLSLDMSDDIGTLIADERKVKQIVFNLLSNAVKFTRDNGQVGIRAHRTDGLVEIVIWDSGVGIAPDDQQRIFEEFQQVGQELTGKPEGTGLGLTLSRKLVELHGGKIRVESTPGQGSTFTFTLPTTDKARNIGLTAGQDEAAEKEVVPTPAADPLVLVIEDDPKAVELLRIYLGEAGHTIETAKDGEEGLEKAKQLSPAAIILDVLLPKVDGWDFLTKVKADAATSNIPVIIVSVLDQKGKGFALGAADYLVKPIEKKALLKSLDAFGLSSKPRTEPMKVLAIDDDPNAVELVAAALEPEGFKVLKTYSGEEGIKTATAERPDIIVLDLLMPGMNGFEVLERLKASPATSKLPVVLFTVKHLTADEKQRLKGRIAKLAQKEEYTPQHLVGIVREVLQGTLQG